MCSGAPFAPETKKLINNLEERFHLAVESAPNAIIMVDQDGKIILLNSQAERYFGYQRDELIGKSVDRLVPSRFSAGHREYRATFLAEPQTRDMGVGRDLYALRKDNSEFPVEIGLAPIKTQQGIFVLATIVDITERKQVEQALRESEERFRLMVEQVADYAIFILDVNGNVLSWNTGAERIKGYKDDEIIGQSYSRFFTPDQIGAGLPDRILRKAESIGHVTVEDWRVRKDGSLFWAKVTLTALRDEQGKLRGFSKVTQDLTARKQVEEELRESQSRLAGIVESAMDAIITIDAEQNIVLFNAAAEQMFGYKVKDIIGQPLGTILPERYRDIHREHIERFGKTGITTRSMGSIQALSGLRANGNEFPIEASISQVEIHGQKIFTVILRDITLRKKAEEKSYRLNKELEAFAYSVSHDLRAPLRGIHGFSNVLVQKYSPNLDEQGRHYISRIQANVHRMGQMIDDLLSLANMTQRELHREKVDLSAVVRDICDEMIAHKTGRAVQFEIEEQLEDMCDAGLIRIVLQNLLENAWKFTSKRNQAMIHFGRTAQNKDGTAVYFVRDNGTGFDMNYAGKLFDAFQRLHNTDEFPGTGIGLATVQRIIYRHGGQIWADFLADAPDAVSANTAPLSTAR